MGQLNHNGGDGLAHGLPRLLTAVKGFYVACPQGCGEPAAYFMPLWTGHYLDLRVVLLDWVILVILLVFMPAVLSHSSRQSVLLRWLQIAAFGCGVCFGLALFIYPITLNYIESWVSPAMLLITVVLAIVGARVIRRGQVGAISTGANDTPDA